ncbi:MAG: TRAP transporter small permease [Pararhodobacter sp.]|nr:TRAP transporter small permease [Pararhodobacter sp.]
MTAEPRHGLVSKILMLAGERPASFFNMLSALLLVTILVLTAADVFGRYILNTPVRGKSELTRILMSIMIALALPATVLRGHSIVVDLLDHLFGRSLALAREVIVNLICAGSLFTLAYWLRFLGLRQQRWGNVTDFLGIPLYPVTFFIAAMVAVAGAMFLLRLLSTFSQWKHRN